MHIGYVPRERPPFSALNFRSGAYNFHKLPKHPFRSITISHFFGGFCRSGDHNFQNVLILTRSTARSAQSVRPRRGLAAGQSARLTRPGSSGESHFTLKTAQTRSGDPHFHARSGPRSGALANFSLCRGTYLPKFGVSNPPPPPPPPGRKRTIMIGLIIALQNKSIINSLYQDYIFK